MRKHIVILVIFGVLVQSVLSFSVSAESSDSVIISHIQTGVSGGATQEFIGLYNNGETEVDVTDWCLRNKGNIAFACLSSTVEQLFIMPAHSSALIVSRSFADTLPLEIVPSLVYVPTSQSSGSLVGSNDTLTLVDDKGGEKDRHGWTTAVATGMIFRRNLTSMDPLIFMNGGSGEDWGIVAREGLPLHQVELRQNETADICPNIAGVQTAISEDVTINDDGTCVLVLPPLPKIIITELFPNAPGSDDGQEFIEVFNAETFPVDISGYQLWIGLNPTKGLPLPVMTPLDPGEYRVITQALLPFSLVNTSGKVQLMNTEGLLMSESAVYDSPKEGQAWILVNDVEWQYSSQPTPGNINIVLSTELEDLLALPVQKSCAANQYRHPETNRCRLIPSEDEATPCKQNQYRNEETNRCRSIAATTTQVACKEGQERNPETNRCRNIKKMTKTDYGVLGATSKGQPSQWYIVLAIVAVMTILLGYAAWEWRNELKTFYQKLLRFVRRAE